MSTPITAIILASTINARGTILSDYLDERWRKRKSLTQDMSGILADICRMGKLPPQTIFAQVERFLPKTKNRFLKELYDAVLTSTPEDERLAMARKFLNSAMANTHVDNRVFEISEMIFTRTEANDDGLGLLTWKASHAWLVDNGTPGMIADLIAQNMFAFTRRAITTDDMTALVEITNSPHMHDEDREMGVINWAEAMIYLRRPEEKSTGAGRCLDVLIGSGADIHAQRRGKCALQLAALYNDRDSPLTVLTHELVAKTLLDRGADWRRIDHSDIPKSLRRIIESHPKVFSDRLSDVAGRTRMNLESDPGNEPGDIRTTKPKI